MPVDPQAQVFLDQLKALDAPPLHTLTPEAARGMVVADLAALGQPEPVHSKQDRTIPGPAGEIPVRIYAPQEEGPLPVLVYFHGGGWTVCDIGTHDGVCCAIANAGRCVVVSVEYRLAPEHKYPAAVEDAYAATEWVFRNAEAIGGVPGRIGVGGDSAGGNLAAVVSLKARDLDTFRPAVQVLIYPVTDFNLDTASYHRCAEGYMLTRDDMRWFFEQYFSAEEDGREPYASPLRAEDLGNLPPALVITAKYDPLCDEGQAYARRLRQAGVPVRLSQYQGMVHGFIRQTAIFDRATVAIREIAEAVNEGITTG